LTAPRTEKQPYRRPTLAVYGGLAELTLTSATSNMNDRMSGAVTMT
jgi:hypothetical protein